MQGKQTKILSPTQERAIVGYLETTRKNRVVRPRQVPRPWNPITLQRHL